MSKENEIKVIDLLERISKAENLPNKIRARSGKIYEYHNNSNNYYYIEDYETPFFNETITFFLNEKIKIIEDDNIKIDIDSIEKLDDTYSCYFHDSKTAWNVNEQTLALKINKLIDAVQHLNKEIQSIKK